MNWEVPTAFSAKGARYVIPQSRHSSTRQNGDRAHPVNGTERELRVLQVFSTLGVGGAETWLMALLKYFHEQNDNLPVRVKFDILLTGGTKEVFDEEAAALGARLFYVPFKRRKMASFIREFRQILGAGNYDAIHDHQDYIAGLHFFIGAGHLPPIRVAHVHNPLYQRTTYANNLGRRAATSIGKHFLGHLATHIMGTSKQIVTEYGFDAFHSRGISLDVAHCGFDLTKYQGVYDENHAAVCEQFGWEESSKIILFVGRLESDEIWHLGQTMTHKNPAFALDVVRASMAKDSRVRLVMVGAGETKRRDFEAMVREWGLAQRICLAGVRRDVQRLMLGSDLLLFPSLAEGLGMVVVEAQAAGLRVLASDTTPLESVVNPDLVAFAPLSASAEEWADAALRLMQLPRLDTPKCNEVVRRSPFSIENSAGRLMKIYNGHQLIDQ